MAKADEMSHAFGVDQVLGANSWCHLLQSTPVDTLLERL
jgi:hypothetical protein